jgi:hypothetical protein
MLKCPKVDWVATFVYPGSSAIGFMSFESRLVSPGPRERTVRTDEGAILSVPKEWELLPPGDAGLTRRVKAAGPTWTVQEKKGRKLFSRGVWALASSIETIRKELEQERSTEAYAKRRQSDANRRDKKQAEYVEDFEDAVFQFLDFAVCYEALAKEMAKRVALHATPVGSGTVARTQRIPIEHRAESAVIAWMRHQTTTYDHMKIARIKGERREVRRMLASKSRMLLEDYRRGNAIDPNGCPLRKALS